MKTYCKDIEVLDLDFIYDSILKCLNGKLNRDDTLSLLSKFSKLNKSQIREIVNSEDRTELFNIIRNIANYMRLHILNRDISLPPIKYSERYDGNSGKLRVIGTQSIIHQCYEYVAVNACMELFKKKFGVYQCASIPGRGQSYGKKAIEKWIKNDNKGTRYAAKMDIRKCYPNVNQQKLKSLLQRDLHKNPTLLYLLFTLVDMYDTGLSIGSHLSQWLCNYYLSYAYHYISEKLFIQRKTRKNGVQNIRMLSHVIFYMDDILIFGNNKKNLMTATHSIILYLENILGLHIKEDWRLFKIIYTGKDQKIHGTFVDMMGFRFFRGKTSIRRSIFIRLRRKFKTVHKKMITHKRISKRLAQSVMSYWGWVKNTNSFILLKKYNIQKIVSVCKKVVSYYDRMSNEDRNKLRNKKRYLRRKRRKRKHVKIT